MCPLVSRLRFSRLRFSPFNSMAHRRRAGQALLLAVLIMIFVALVGATFITVVALNMDATATQEERHKAASAANAGMEVINYQINANGTDWRPEKIAPPPAPGDPGYSYYWSAQDIAQGYARTTQHPFSNDHDGDGQFYSLVNPDYEDDWRELELAKANGSRLFVKFPDPRLEQNTGSHTYMAEVNVIPQIAGIQSDEDKQGMLRITVIGQSSDDPNVFVKRVAYKGTSEKNGAFAWDQFFTNWNYVQSKNTTASAKSFGTVPASVLPPYPIRTTIVIDKDSGIVPGRLITIQNPADPTQIENALVQRVEYQVPDANSERLTLTSTLTIAYPVGASVRAASPLTNGLIGREGLAAARGQKTQFNAEGQTSGGEPGSDTWEATMPQNRSLGYGLMSNADLQLIGKANFVLNADATLPQPSKFHVAGTILPAPAAAASPTSLPYNTRFNDTVAPAAPGPNLPTSFNSPTIVGTGTGQQLQVDDNPNPTQAEDLTRTSRNVRPQIPPDLTNFPRLLEVTKYTPGGIEGLGAGIYINNGQDIEKVFESGALRALSVSDMHRLWLGKSFPAPAGQGNADHGATGGVSQTVKDGHRLVYPRIGSPTTDNYFYPVLGSLEQRGVRGWINTYEFLPRGALVEIQPNQIVVTLDDRSDTGGLGPDPNKAWRYTNNSNQPNCYRMTINTNPASGSFGQRAFGAPGFEVNAPAPTERFNGVIYAEGNLRVRGQSGTLPLTIVSMNNIYIEGNLVRGAGHIALLARKNVTLNPTQFTTRLNGAQDQEVATQAIPVTVAATNTGTGADATAANRLAVSSLNTFRLGDYIRVGTDTTWRQVVRKVTPDGLVLKPALAAAATAATAIRIKSVAATVTAASTGNTITVSSKVPFRVGDRIRVDDNLDWLIVTAIDPDPTDNILTLSATLTASVGDSVQILADPDFVPGANLPSPAPAIWPTEIPAANAPASLTTGDYFQSPEWFYRLSSPRDVLVRDIRFDGVSPGAAAGAGYQLSQRMIGERKLAYKLNMVTNPAAVLGPQKVMISENNNPNDVHVDAAELRFKGTGYPTGPTTGIPLNEFFDFDYDLRDVLSPSGTYGDDNIQTLAALQQRFNTEQKYPDPAGPPAPDIEKWRLDPVAATTPQNVNVDNNEAQAIAARYLLPMGIDAGDADDWTGNTTDPKRLYLSTAARIFTGTDLNFTNPFYKLGAASNSTAGTRGDVATSRPGFYYYMYTGGTPAKNYERQEWLTWQSRPPFATFGTNLVTALTLESSMVGSTGSLAPLRATAFKFERQPFNVAGAYQPVDIQVQATIFAQEGSWFAIPAPLQHRNDLDNDGDGFEANEISVATRMRRPNYRITVQGRLIQNFAPTAINDYNFEESPSGETSGAIAQWADSLSHPSNLVALSGFRGRDWNTIIYNFDTQIPVNSSLMLPPSPDLSYGS